MANNPTILSQHHLNFDDRKVMMEQISEILNANVHFGFHSNIDCSEHLEIIQWGLEENPYSYDCYLIDKIEKDVKLPNAIMIDSDYSYSWLYEKYGEKAGDLPSFKKNWGADAAENLRTIKWFMQEDRLYIIYFEDFCFDICRATIRLHTDRIPYKYWDLLYQVLSIHYSIDELTPDFDKNKAIAQLFGESGIYYVNDSSRYLGLGQLQEINMTWEEVMFEMTRHIHPNDIINIRKCMVDLDYVNHFRKKMVGENFRKYPVLYDDFKDYK